MAFAVGAIAAIISWSHIVHVALEYGKQTQAILGLKVASLYPVSIDGAMIVGVIAAADDRANGLEVRRWARVATWFGGILSVAAQVTSAWPDGPLARGIAAVPSGALIVVVEVLTKRGKIADPSRRKWWQRKRAAVTSVPSVEAVAVSMVEPVVTVVPESTPVEPAPEPAPAKPRRRRRSAGMAGYPGPTTEAVTDVLADLKAKPRAVEAKLIEPAQHPELENV